MLSFSFSIESNQLDDFRKFDNLTNIIINDEIKILAVSGFELTSDLSLLNDLIRIIETYTQIIEMNSTNTGFSFYVISDEIDELVRMIHRKIK